MRHHAYVTIHDLKGCVFWNLLRFSGSSSFEIVHAYSQHTLATRIPESTVLLIFDVHSCLISTAQMYQTETETGALL